MDVPSWIPQDKELYLFDIDGVIIRKDAQFSTLYAREAGLEPGATEIFFRGKFQDCLVGSADLKEEIASFLKNWNWGKGVDAYLDLWFQKESNINQEIWDAVEQLHNTGSACYFATNQEKYRTKYLKDNMKLKNISSGILSSSDLGAKKPDPVFFERVLSKVGFSGKPIEVFFVDDDLENIETAKEMGFDTFYYKA